MTHGFNLEDTFGENTIANQGLIALCHKIQTEVKYILSCEIRTVWVSSLYMEFCSAMSSCSSLKYMMTLTCTCQSNSKLGPQFKFVYFLFSLKSSCLCYLWTNLGLRKYVFSLWLFCPSLNVLPFQKLCFHRQHLCLIRLRHVISERRYRHSRLTKQKMAFNMFSHNQWIPSL